jgi:ribA/ribD-fused uncharacterized protein
MNGNLEQRTYTTAEAVVFRKTNEVFGGLSNMAPGFPVLVNNVRFWTSEALYQCCRFPDAPEVQKLIVSQRSPMTAKMKSKRYRKDWTRPDWDNVKVRVMRWCLRVKLAQNLNNFGRLLLSTGDRPIVEESAKDQFWGAKSEPGGLLKGANVLGRLLMELRDQLRSSEHEFQQVPPPQVSNFLLFRRPIGVVNGATIRSYSEMASEGTPYQLAPQKVKISGNVRQSDWDNLLHVLAESKLSPENVSLNIELLLPHEKHEDPKMRMLAELARRLGMQFRVLS